MLSKKVVAIENLNGELYRLIKTYASLENRTIASVIEEAVRNWFMNRKDYGEVLAWVKLEEEYQRNLDALRKKLSGCVEGYALICNGEVVGVFNNYLDAVRKSIEIQASQAMIVRLPLESKLEKLELGLP